MQIGSPTPAPGPTPGRVDVARLLARLQADPGPRLTWYSGAGDRVELTGRVLVQWVAKTAHLLLEEADVEAGSRVAVRLGPDWRAPVLWLAAWYLGAEVTGDGSDPSNGSAGGSDGGSGGSGAPDVDVVREHGVSPSPGAVVLVVAAAALPRPVEDLPPGAVDYGAEVSAQPDSPPAPGPAAVLPVTPGPAARVLLGPDATRDQVLSAWAAGGSVVLHTGLTEEALARVRDQERATPPLG